MQNGLRRQHLEICRGVLCLVAMFVCPCGVSQVRADAACDLLTSSSLRKNAVTALEKRQYGVAVTEFRQALDACPKQRAILLELSEAYARNRDFPLAIRAAQEFLESEANSIQADRFEPTQYKLHNAVFLNRGDGTFGDQSETVGSEFLTPHAHRGAAFADFNNDGKIDVVVTALGEPAELWENMTPGDNTWLILKLIGAKSNRDGIGARVRAGNQYNHMTSTVGYASSSHFGVHFGTGTLKQVDEIEVRWPNGKVQILKGVPTNQVLPVRE